MSRGIGAKRWHPTVGLVKSSTNNDLELGIDKAYRLTVVYIRQRCFSGLE